MAQCPRLQRLCLVADPCGIVCAHVSYCLQMPQYFADFPLCVREMFLVCIPRQRRDLNAAPPRHYNVPARPADGALSAPARPADGALSAPTSHIVCKCPKTLPTSHCLWVRRSWSANLPFGTKDSEKCRRGDQPMSCSCVTVASLTPNNLHMILQCLDLM